MRKMGGRGSSSGVSNSGKPYGTEFATLLQISNIKYVRHNKGSATAPMETMTRGRVYVTVNADNALKYITYYDKKNKRFKQIDLTRPHKINGVMTIPHTHKGYEHSEKGVYNVSIKEQEMIDRVTKIWHNRNGK